MKTPPRDEELARKQLLADRMFSTMRWLLELANQEYGGKSFLLRNEIDFENYLNHIKKNQNRTEMRLWN